MSEKQTAMPTFDDVDGFLTMITPKLREIDQTKRFTVFLNIMQTLNDV